MLTKIKADAFGCLCYDEHEPERLQPQPNRCRAFIDAVPRRLTLRIRSMASRHVQYCAACFTLFDATQTHCPHCGALAQTFSERDYQQKLLHALDHPLAEVRMRAIIALGLRAEAQASEALIQCALRWPADVVQGLQIVASLASIARVTGQRSALERLAREHPAHAVQEAARSALTAYHDAR